MLYQGQEKTDQMTRKTISLLALVIAIALVVPTAYAVEPETKDLTKLFRDGGVNVDQLQVVAIGGIVVIRGRTDDMERAAEAGRFAQTLGYTRVANLVQLSAQADDALIQRRAERELTIHRGLEGSKLGIASRRGIVSLTGRLSDVQRDMAVQLIRNIDGVRGVNTDGVQR
jgi:osmotically-inducible protein OsmY